MAGVALGAVQAILRDSTSVPSVAARLTADEKTIKKLQTANTSLKKKTDALTKSVASMKKQIRTLAARH